MFLREWLYRDVMWWTSPQKVRYRRGNFCKISGFTSTMWWFLNDLFMFYLTNGEGWNMKTHFLKGCLKRMVFFFHPFYQTRGSDPPARRFRNHVDEMSIVRETVSKSRLKFGVGAFFCKLLRIIPFSKWLRTMVGKSPNWGCSLYKWPKWLINGGY